MLTPESLATLAGDSSVEGLKLAQQVLSALQKIDPGLVPSLRGGDYAEEIRRGEQAVDDLIVEYDAAQSDDHRVGILLALYYIARLPDALDKNQIDMVRGVLSDASDSDIATGAARVLAAARDRDFLSSQMDELNGEDRDRQNIAAQFLGIGKFTVAVPRMLQLLDPGNATVRKSMLWSLGEMGSGEAVTPLLDMMGSGAEVDLVADALGKIGDPSAVPALIDVMNQGVTEQRRAAAKAISRISATAGGSFGTDELDTTAKAALKIVFEKTDDVLTGFYAMAAYGRLGGQLTPAEVRKALGEKLGGDDMTAMSSFFSRDKS